MADAIVFWVGAFGIGALREVAKRAGSNWEGANEENVGRDEALRAHPPRLAPTVELCLSNTDFPDLKDGRCPAALSRRTATTV
jgi:hypothetical protein